MEIEVTRVKDLSLHDTGGGTRDVKAVITVDDNMPPRMQRKVVLYETIGLVLGYIMTHEQVDDFANLLLDVLDQLEPI